MTNGKRFVAWMTGGGILTVSGVLWYGAQALKAHDAAVAQEAARLASQDVDHKRLARLEILYVNIDKQAGFNYQVIMAVAGKLGLKEGDQIPMRPQFEAVPNVEGSPMPVSPPTGKVP